MASFFSLFKSEHEKLALEAFKPLDQLESGASKKITDYILYNKDRNALNTIKQAGRQKLTAMGYWFPRNYIGMQSPERLLVLKKARISIENFVKSDAFANTAVAKRFAEVMFPACEIEVLDSYLHTDKKVQWLVYLLAEIEVSTERGSKDEQSWSIVTKEWFKKLVSEADLPVTFVPSFILETSGKGLIGSLIKQLDDQLDWEEYCVDIGYRQTLLAMPTTAKLVLAKKISKIKSLAVTTELIVDILKTDSEDKFIRPTYLLLLTQLTWSDFDKFILNQYQSFPDIIRRELVRLVFRFPIVDRVKIWEEILSVETKANIKELLHRSISEEKFKADSANQVLFLPNYEPNYSFDASAIKMFSKYQNVVTQEVLDWFNKNPDDITDFRQLEDSLVRAGISIEQIAIWLIGSDWTNYRSKIPSLPRVSIWPFFVRHPEFLNEALSPWRLLKDEKPSYSFSKALEILEIFTFIPTYYLDGIYEYALSENKLQGDKAREFSERNGLEKERVLEALQCSQLKTRRATAKWLSELDTCLLSRDEIESLLTSEKNIKIISYLESLKIVKSKHKVGQ